MLQYVIEQPGKPVCEIARELRLPRPVASQHLRALNARGLLRARRTGRWVHYWAKPDENVPDAKLLLAAIRHTFQNDNTPLETIYRLATAFTHPRRQQIFEALRARSLALQDLRDLTAISFPALSRHMTKLANRGFVAVDAGRYKHSVPQSKLAKVLSQLAVASPR